MLMTETQALQSSQCASDSVTMYTKKSMPSDRGSKLSDQHISSKMVCGIEQYETTHYMLFNTQAVTVITKYRHRGNID